MVSIEEMKEYKKRKNIASGRLTLRCEIVKLEEKVLGMSKDVEELIEYGNTAVDCGCLPPFSEYDKCKGAYMWNNKTRIYTDHIYHKFGYVAYRPSEEILAIGIHNGGSNGHFDLEVRPGKIDWIPCERIYEEPDKYSSEAYKACLTAFTDCFESFRQRVYDCVEKKVKEEK